MGMAGGAVLTSIARYYLSKLPIHRVHSGFVLWDASMNGGKGGITYFHQPPYHYKLAIEFFTTQEEASKTLEMCKKEFEALKIGRNFDTISIVPFEAINATSESSLCIYSNYNKEPIK